MLSNYMQVKNDLQTCQAIANNNAPYLELSYNIENYYSLLTHITDDPDPRWILFIAPPGKPNVTFLQQAGVHKNRIITLPQSKISNHAELLKSALESHNYSTVVTWFTDCDKALQSEINALAREANSRCFIYCTQ